MAKKPILQAEEPKEFNLRCQGWDEDLHFTYWKIGEEELIFSHSIPSFYAYQRPIRTYFSRMLKMIYCAITGKEYLFFEMVLDAKQIKEFKKWVRSL